MGSHCAGPKRQHHVQVPDPTCIQPQRRGSVSLERIASYKTPLPSHLARHLLVYFFYKEKSMKTNIYIHNALLITNRITKYIFSKKYNEIWLTLFFNHDKLVLVLRRNTQVWLKGSVLKTDRRVIPRGGSNPSSSSILNTHTHKFEIEFVA